MTGVRGRRAFLALAAAPFTGPVRAHTMDVGTVTLNVVDHRVYVAASLPARAFASQDPAAVAALVTRAMKVGNGVREVALQGVLVSPEEGGHSHDGQPHALLVLGVAVFESRPERMRLWLDRRILPGAPKLKVIASRTDAQGAKSTEERWLATGHTSVEFPGRLASLQASRPAPPPAALARTP